MKPVKQLKSECKEDGSFRYGVIMSDGTQAEIYYFDEWGNPTEIIDTLISLRFKFYCESNNLNQYKN